jgi:hypothetical protein
VFRVGKDACPLLPLSPFTSMAYFFLIYLIVGFAHCLLFLMVPSHGRVVCAKYLSFTYCALLAVGVAYQPIKSIRSKAIEIPFKSFTFNHNLTIEQAIGLTQASDEYVEVGAMGGLIKDASDGRLYQISNSKELPIIDERCLIWLWHAKANKISLRDTSLTIEGDLVPDVTYLVLPVTSMDSVSHVEFHILHSK